MRLWEKTIRYIRRHLRHLSDLDKRLLSITPPMDPMEFSRTPRSIETTLKFWKGECAIVTYVLIGTPLSSRTPLLVAVLYSPVVLYRILPEDYYQHHLLLVEAIFGLLKDVVTSDDISHSRNLIQHFCFMFAPWLLITRPTCLYKHATLCRQTFQRPWNVHGLLHLPEVVKNLGFMLLFWKCERCERRNPQRFKG